MLHLEIELVKYYNICMVDNVMHPGFTFYGRRRKNMFILAKIRQTKATSLKAKK